MLTSKSGMCKMAQGGLLGPVHARSRLGNRVCVSAWLRWHPGYYLGATYLLSRRGLRLLSRPGLRRSYCLSISAGLRRSYYLSACAGSGYYCISAARAAATIYLGMRGPPLLSRYTGCSYYLGICGPQLLSRYARAAATISARAAVRLSQRGLRRGYYLGVGCAATISAYAGRSYCLGMSAA